MRAHLRDAEAVPAHANFVHAPDEPADVLRELLVLCDVAEQEQIITALLAAGEWSRHGPRRPRERPPRHDVAVRASPADDPDIAATLRRMRARLRDSSLLLGSTGGHSSSARPRRKTPWTTAVAGSTRGNDPHWDRIVPAASWWTGGAPGGV